LPEDISNLIMPIYQGVVLNNIELNKEEFIDASKKYFFGLTPTEKGTLLGIKKKKKSSQSLNTTFRPEIDNFSSAIASKNRVDGIHIEDKLIDQGRMSMIKIQAKQKQKESLATEHCTFSPNINKK
jgi:hypothetical protein